MSLKVTKVTKKSLNFVKIYEILLKNAVPPLPLNYVFDILEAITFDFVFILPNRV